MTAIECPVSVVIACHNEAAHLPWTVDSFLPTLPPEGEIVVVDDHSTDEGTAFLAESAYQDVVQLLRPPTRLGAAAARSFGAANARGEVLVFSDAHVKVSPGWVEATCSALKSPGVGAVSPATTDLDRPERKGFGRTWQGDALEWRWPPNSEDATDPNATHPVPLLPGCFLATRHDVVRKVGCFDSAFNLWGNEGAELSLRLWLMGYEMPGPPEHRSRASLSRRPAVFEIDCLA